MDRGNRAAVFPTGRCWMRAHHRANVVGFG
jgi:hypothetical protein